MSYVLRYKNERNETKYILTQYVSLYSPELAAHYESKKTAQTIAKRYINNGFYPNVEVVYYTYDIILEAHYRYTITDDRLLYPDFYRNNSELCESTDNDRIESDVTDDKEKN